MRNSQTIAQGMICWIQADSLGLGGYQYIAVGNHNNNWRSPQISRDGIHVVWLVCPIGKTVGCEWNCLHSRPCSSLARSCGEGIHRIRMVCICQYRPNFQRGYLQFCMEGTEHLNKVIKANLTYTNGHFLRESKMSCYKLGDDTFVQLLRRLRAKYILNMHDIPKTKREKHH